MLLIIVSSTPEKESWQSIYQYMDVIQPLQIVPPALPQVEFVLVLLIEVWPATYMIIIPRMLEEGIG